MVAVAAAVPNACIATGGVRSEGESRADVGVSIILIILFLLLLLLFLMVQIVDAPTFRAVGDKPPGILFCKDDVIGEIW